MQELPSSIRFNFTLVKELKKGASISFAGQEYKSEQLKSVVPAEAMSRLFIEEKIPFWIDLYVDGFDEEFTYIAITFSEEFTDNDELLFNKSSHLPPFHIIGPTVPENWKSLEEDGRFPFIPFT